MLKIDIAHSQVKASGLWSLLLGHSYLGHTRAKVKSGTGEPSNSYQFPSLVFFSKQNLEWHTFLKQLCEVEKSDGIL